MMKNIILSLGLLLSFSALAAPECTPSLLRIGGATSSYKMEQRCSSENILSRKFTIVRKNATDSVSASIDSKNYEGESRKILEETILEFMDQGVSKSISSYIRSNINPLLSNALKSSGDERADYIRQAELHIEEMLLH